MFQSDQYNLIAYLKYAKNASSYIFIFCYLREHIASLLSPIISHRFHTAQSSGQSLPCHLGESFQDKPHVIGGNLPDRAIIDVAHLSTKYIFKANRAYKSQSDRIYFYEIFRNIADHDSPLVGAV